MIYYVTGGARSGKSSYAMGIAKKLSEVPLYIATARRWDDEFEKRIKIHEEDRKEGWITIEEETSPGKLDLEGKVAVLDCVTLWLTNLFVDLNQDINEVLQVFKNEIDLMKKKNATIIIISNELGMGLHADAESGRKFTDLQGWANQYVASQSAKAIFMVSGLPLFLKE